MELNERIGRQIKTARKTRRLTVKALSEASGVSERAIYHTEAGETIMRVDSLDLVAKVLGIQVVLGGKTDADKR